jgi:hypothetical protein
MKDKLILIIRDSLAHNIGKSCNLAENIATDILNSDFVLVPKDEIIEFKKEIENQSKSITNYDRIQNMSIEELADFLMEVNQAYGMDCMLGVSECKYPNVGNNCSLCFKDYLKTEVEE